MKSRMMARKHVSNSVWSLSIASLLVFTLVTSAWATDLDIFNPAANVQPNVMFIFDTSGSMDDSIVTAAYDPSTTYTCSGCTYTTNSVYLQNRRRGNFLNTYTKICNDVNANPLTCNPSSATPTATGKTALRTTGFWYRDNTTHEFLGNYLNFRIAFPVTTRRKIDIAKDVMNELIDSASGVRMGLMVFNTDQGGRVVFPVTTMTSTAISNMHSQVNNASPGGWTPLAETLYEDGLYFSGRQSRFNGSLTYTSPIQAACQSNHTIIITDGSPTQDLDLPSLIGDQDGDRREPGMVNAPNYASSGSDYLDDVANYWFHTDMRSDLPGLQSMRTYTVGFSTATDPLANPLLQRTAEHGGGSFFTANNTSELKESLRATLVEIAEISNSFIAPVIPIDQANRTTNGDYLYLSLFAPSSNALWPGNLKKFALDNQGNLIDADGEPAVAANGTIYDTARSIWTPSGTSDGGDVRQGGAEGVLEARTSERNIYTAMGSSNNLTDATNAFTIDNTSITNSSIGVPDDVEHDRLIDFVRGIDTYDDDADGNFSEKREKILGDFLHSRPAVVHYDSDTTLIFAGNNDGMFHVFNDSDGSERWAFVPSDIRTRLEELRGTTHPLFVDGSPSPLVIDANGDGQIRASDGDKVVVIFGRRRGGNAYTALDVTNPDAPTLLYQISASSSGFSELGQSWSRPFIAKAKVGTTDTWVAFIGAGYDANEDADPVAAADTHGRGVFAFNAITGARIWDFRYDSTNTTKAQMVYAIPSDVTVLDTNSDGYLDRLYVGDLGGQLWRFGGSANSSDVTTWTGKIIFKAKSSESDSARRKFFFQPDVLQEQNYDVVLIGTGDHEHPLSTSVIDRLYSIRDNNPSSAYIETDLVDVTNDLLQTGTSDQRATIKNDLASHHGYLIKMVEDPTASTGLGEKVLAPPLTFVGTAFFTTFVPNGSQAACTIGGISRLYAVNYLTGVASINFYTNNDSNGQKVLAREDRRLQIGASIASSPVIALRGGREAQGGYNGTANGAGLYVGTGGGIVETPLENPANNILLLDWRQLQ